MSTLSALPPDLAHEEHVGLRRIWLFLFVLGLVSFIAGFVAISATYFATMASVMVFGILLLVAGVTEVVHAVTVRHWKGFGLHLLAAGLYLFTGLFILEAPVRAAEVLTLLLAACFLVGGVLRSIFAIALRFPAWGWVLLNGVVDLVLGGIILSGWPESSLWVLGLLLGIDLVFHGWSWMILALTVRTFHATPSPGYHHAEA
jgi:uncharacterized membrane protein HdeD (DUF308 family)